MAGQTPGSAGAGIKKVFATGLAENNTIDREGVGTIRHEGNSVYKWIKYNSGAGAVAAIAGDVAYYYGVGGDAVSGGYENHEVTMDRTDGYLGAGVLQSVIPNGSFGWVQIRGPATLTNTLTAGADGDGLTHRGADADGRLDVVSAIIDPVVAIATDASARKIICMFPW